MRIETTQGPIVVWRPPGGRGRSAVVYVHGFGDTVDSAIGNHRLLEQFTASGVDAVFVLPEARSGGGEPIRFPNLAAMLGRAGVKTDHVTLVIHSGGHREMRNWISDPRVKHLILLDALYGGEASVIAWGRQPGHTMALVGKDTAAASRRVATATGAPYYDGVTHMGIVTREGWIARLLGDAPIPQPWPTFLLVGAAAAIGYYLYKRFS